MELTSTGVRLDRTLSLFLKHTINNPLTHPPVDHFCNNPSTLRRITTSTRLLRQSSIPNSFHSCLLPSTFTVPPRSLHFRSRLFHLSFLLLHPKAIKGLATLPRLFSTTVAINYLQLAKSNQPHLHQQHPWPLLLLQPMWPPPLSILLGTTSILKPDPTTSSARSAAFYPSFLLAPKKIISPLISIITSS